MAWPFVTQLHEVMDIGKERHGGCLFSAECLDERLVACRVHKSPCCEGCCRHVYFDNADEILGKTKTYRAQCPTADLVAYLEAVSRNESFYATDFCLRKWIKRLEFGCRRQGGWMNVNGEADECTNQQDHLVLQG